MAWGSVTEGLPAQPATRTARMALTAMLRDTDIHTYFRRLLSATGANVGDVAALRSSVPKIPRNFEGVPASLRFRNSWWHSWTGGYLAGGLLEPRTIMAMLHTVPTTPRTMASHPQSGLASAWPLHADCHQTLAIKTNPRHPTMRETTRTTTCTATFFMGPWCHLAHARAGCGTTYEQVCLDGTLVTTG